MNEKPDIAQRVLVGPVLVLAGVGLYAGLFVLSQFPPKDFYHAVGVALCAEAYGIIAGLFILMGLKYILGPRRWIGKFIGKSLKRLIIVSALMTAVIVAAFLISLW